MMEYLCTIANHWGRGHSPASARAAAAWRAQRLSDRPQGVEYRVHVVDPDAFSGPDWQGRFTGVDEEPIETGVIKTESGRWETRDGVDYEIETITIERKVDDDD